MDGNKKATLELGTKPVGRLLVEYATPAIIAMTATSLYNTVDSIFIGQGVGPLAISALALTLPLMNLAGAFGAGVGVGASTFMSVKLGQRDYKTAVNILGNTLTLNFVISIIFAVAALLLLNPILRIFGASDNTLPYAREYLIIILAGNPITHQYLGLNNMLRAASKPRQAMAATIFTVLLNTALDPVFIYGFGMGIQGAAVATVLAQAVALVWELRLFSNSEELLHFTRGTYRLRSSIVRNIIGIGISPFAMNVCACVVVIFINNSLTFYGGDLAVGAYGIGNRIAFIFLMVVMGINQGMQPIAGYNYGALHFDRLMRVVRYAMIAATCITTTAFIVGELAPRPLARMFTTDAELTRLSVKAIRIMVMVFPVVGFQMVVTNFFQSIGKVKISVFLSLSRQLIFLLPLTLTLPLVLGVDGVWFSLPAADTISTITAWVLMSRYMKRFKRARLESAPTKP